MVFLRGIAYIFDMTILLRLLTLVMACLPLSALAEGLPWTTLRVQDSLTSMQGDSAIAKVKQYVQQAELSNDARLRIAASLRLGELYATQGKYQEAFAPIRYAAELRMSLPFGDSLRIQCLYSLAMLYLIPIDLKEMSRAEMYLHEALDGYEYSTWCTPERQIQILEKYAWILDQERKGDLAKRAYRKILDICESISKPDSSRIAKTLWIYHRMARDGQRFEEAQGYTKQLANLLEVNPKITYPTPSMILAAEGDDLTDLGKYPEAIHYYIEALPKLAEEVGPNSCQLAKANYQLGECLAEINRFEDAEPYYKAAVDIFHTCGELNPPYFYVSTLTALGHVYLEQRKLAEAEEQLTLALDIASDSLNPYEDAFTYLLLDLARLYDYKGDVKKAEYYYWQALIGADYIHKPSDPRIANFLEPFAEFLYVTGRKDIAQAMEGRAFRLRVSTLGDGHPEVAESYHKLSMMRQWFTDDQKSVYSINDSSEAIPLQSRAWSIRQENLYDAIRVLDEPQLLSFAKALQDESSNFYSLLMHYPLNADVKRNIGRAIFGSKAQVWDAIAGKSQAAAVDTIPALKQIYDSLQTVRQAISREYVRVYKGEDFTEYASRIDSLLKEKKRLQEGLTYRNKSFNLQTSLWELQANDVAAFMPEQSVLVEFVRYDYRINMRKTTPRYLAFVLKPDSSSEVVPLGSANVIDSLVMVYRSEFSDPNNLDLIEYNRVAKQLYQKIWTPIEHFCKSNDLIFLAPDGALNYVSFASLIDNDDKYLVENHSLHYLSSGREIYRLTKVDTQNKIGKGVAIFGDPDFDAKPIQLLAETKTLLADTILFAATHSRRGQDSSSRLRSGNAAFSHSSWKRVPSTQLECKYLYDELANRTDEPCAMYLGSQANEDIFKRVAPNNRILYLASHGFSLNDHNIQHSLQLDNPLLSSGFVLAGANLKSDEIDSLGINDGLVTSEEIASMDFHNTDIAILSACETGVGKLESGQGTYALRRAFEIAGVKTVVSSLWPVDDQATSELMQALSHDESSTVSEAINQAEKVLITTAREKHVDLHPYYWAGFVPSGDWRTYLVPRSIAKK